MCDTVVVVLDGEVLFAKNSDRDPNEAQRLEWYPRRSYPPGSQLACTWRVIPQVEQTWATVLSRPYWMWGAEMGTNEHGVVIGNEAVFTRKPLEASGLTGMDLVRLGLERGRTADEAVDVIAALAERHGQGGRCGYDAPGFSYHGSFLIADKSGAWVLETAGREHARERVQRGARAISNGLTLPALEHFADPLRSRVAQSARRRGCVEEAARRATTPAELARVLRSHGGDEVRYSVFNGAMAAPCMHAGGLFANSQTVASWVARLGRNAEHYVTATAAPCLSAFKPIAVNQPIDTGCPSGIEGDSVWWRFERLHRALVGQPGEAAKYRELRDRWEEATWSRARAPADAFSDWDAFVAEATQRWGVAERDERPRIVRRYWERRAIDARAAAPKLPRHGPVPAGR